MATSLELFVISDLHIGGALPSLPGERGFRINTHMAELAAFLRELVARRLDQQEAMELVINGDFVDFLAEADPQDGRHHAFVAEADHASALFDAITLRDSDFFDALAELLASGCALTLLLGNHDIELSLPAVRERLCVRLGLTGLAGLRFVYDGEAYSVGDVLIEHGNRYDGWNVVDHDRLRRSRSEASRRLAPSAAARFEPPAGSLMVQRLINPIKHEYPFVDLLKPETAAALPLLLALEPSLATQAALVEVARLRAKAWKHEPNAPARPTQSGDIAAGEEADTLSPLAELLAGQMGEQEAADLMALLRQARQAQDAQRGEISGGTVARALSFFGLPTAGHQSDRMKSLLDALRTLQGDHSFRRDVEGDKHQWAAAQELAAVGFAVVIFGHTHLAKKIALADGATYINTGTWADLIRLPDIIVSGPRPQALVELERFANALRAREFGEYLTWQPTFAHLRFDKQRKVLSAELRTYSTGCLESL